MATQVHYSCSRCKATKRVAVDGVDKVKKSIKCYCGGRLRLKMDERRQRGRHGFKN